MQNLKSKLNGFVTGLLFAISLTVLAAGLTDLSDSATKGKVSRAHGGTGNVMSLSAASAAASAVNTAGGLVATDSGNKLPALDGSALTAISAAQVTGVLAISGAVVTNDTFVAASSTVMTPVHHATAPTYIANHTFTTTDVNTLSPINAGSSAPLTMTLDTTLTLSESDMICVEQTGAGKVTFAASGVAAPDSSSGYMSICAQSGVACLLKKASGTMLVGCRGS